MVMCLEVYEDMQEKAKQLKIALFFTEYSVFPSTVHSTLITIPGGFQESNSGNEWVYAVLHVSLFLNMNCTDMQKTGNFEVFVVWSSVECCCHLTVSRLQVHLVFAI